MKKSNNGFNLRDLASLFIPKIWLITLIGVVVAVLFGGASQFFKKKTYSSDASLIMLKEYPTAGDIDLIHDMLDACIEVMYKDIFLKSVVNDINDKQPDNQWGLTTEYIASVTKIKKLDSDQVFDIVVTTNNAELSYVIADSFSHQAKEKLPQILKTSTSSVEFNITEYAERAGTANSKKVLRNSIIGFGIGFALAMIGVFAYSVLDVVVRDKKKLEDNFDIPVLGVIPDYDVNIGQGEAVK